MSYTWNLDNDFSIKSASVTYSEDIIFIRLAILVILALIIEFDLQITFTIHINTIVVFERKKNLFFLRH